MKCLIVEDEHHAAELLQYLLSRCRQKIEVVAVLDSVKSATLWLKNNEADLCFFDIQLGDDIVFSIFDNIELNTPVIFTTSYDKFAIKAFNQNSIGYLLKPIDQNLLQAALDKFEKLNSIKIPIQELSRHYNPFQKRFLVQSGNALISLRDDEIAYFSVQNKYVFISALNGTQYLFEGTLDALEKRLDPGLFFRINRQFILSMNAIRKMEIISRGRVLVEATPQSPEEMIVSIDRSQEFKNWLNK